MDTPEAEKVTFKRVFKFRYADYAVLFGMSQSAVRKAAQRGQFNPSDLASVAGFYNKRHGIDGSKIKMALYTSVDGIRKTILDLQKLEAAVSEQNRTQEENVG